MVQVRIEIVHGELDMMIARRVSSYSYRVAGDGGSYNLTLY